MAEDSNLATKVAGEAAFSILNVSETHYTHEICIDDAAGIYDCDCSGFVEYLLSRTAPNQLAPLRDLSTDERPLAHDFYTFFSCLPTTESAGTNGWLQITTLEDTTRGDIVAWNLHDSNEPGDTGHVFVIAEAPTPLIGGHDSSATFAVKVYDSSSKEHFGDSRGDGNDFKAVWALGLFIFRPTPMAPQFGFDSAKLRPTTRRRLQLDGSSRFHRDKGNALQRVLRQPLK